MVESVVGAVAASLAGAAIAASAVSVSAAGRSAAAATAGVIASAALAAAATERCETAASGFSTNAAARVTCAAALATWTDLWACTATCAICHARTWTAILCWTGIAISREKAACWTASVRVQKSQTEPQRGSTGCAGACRALDSGAHNPHREPKAQPRAGGDPEQYNRTSSAHGDEFR